MSTEFVQPQQAHVDASNDADPSADALLARLATAAGVADEAPADSSRTEVEVVEDDTDEEPDSVENPTNPAIPPGQPVEVIAPAQQPTPRESLGPKERKEKNPTQKAVEQAQSLRSVAITSKEGKKPPTPEAANGQKEIDDHAHLARLALKSDGEVTYDKKPGLPLNVGTGKIMVKPGEGGRYLPAHEGETGAVQLTSITHKENGSFTCTVDGQTEPIKVSIDTVLDAQAILVVESNKDSGILSPEELAFLTNYLQHQSDENEAEVAKLFESKETSDLIAKYISEERLIEQPALKKFITKLVPDVAPEKGKELTAEQQLHNQDQEKKRQLLLAQLTDYKFITPELIGDIFEQAVDRDSFVRQANLLENQLDLLYQQGADDRHPSVIKIKQDLEFNRGIQRFMLKNEQSLRPMVETVFGQMESGQMDQETIADFRVLFSDGDLEGLCKSIYDKYKDTLPEDVKTLLEQLLSNKALLVGGGLALIIVVIAMQGIKQEAEKHM